jgi:ABC-2 type transport system permease protein
MTTIWSAVGDSATMLRRDLRHTLRNPSTMMISLLTPVILVLLFVYVLGRAMGAGLGGAAGAAHGSRYIDYIVPGVIMMTAGYGAASTAVRVATDSSEGIIDRFRTMAISRGSVPAGHVMGSVIRTMASIGVILGLTVLMGFRSGAGPAEWIAAAGVIAMLVLAITWLSVALGLLARTPENAQMTTMVPVLLPFVSSAFVPTALMPSGLAGFARYQPFTPVIETVRGLLLGTPIGGNAVLAAGWCAAITLAGYLWSRRLFNREPIR